MRVYTIGQVAEMFGLPTSTLRYYDKQGLFPELKRASGIRQFGDTELEALRVIECLKKAGMEIKDITSTISSEIICSRSATAKWHYINLLVRIFVDSPPVNGGEKQAKT